MVVGKKQWGDLKFTEPAIIKIKDKKFKARVFGSKRRPLRRDIFVPKRVRDRIGRLPRKALVKWKGKRFKGRLGFRTGVKGTRIPVYTFKIDTPSRMFDPADTILVEAKEAL